jgi:biopolymer transport protein ExbD
VSFTQREARKLIRKAVGRVPEGEDIRHLNIMPMMDMMTILLVAVIFQAAASSTIDAAAVSLPRSLSDDAVPENAVTLIITKSSIVVDKEPIVSINKSSGDVDPAQKEGGSLGVKIKPLTQFLASFRQEQERNLRLKPDYDPAKEPPPELFIIADRTTSYRLLLEVMFSAKQQEAGYKHFRLIVQKSLPVSPPK